LDTLQQEPFDAVILHHVFMAQYREQFDAPAILEEHNIESDIFKQHAQLPHLSPEERTFRQTRWMLLRRYETAQWSRFPRITAVSPQNAAEIRRRSPKSFITVIENGLDVSRIQMLPPSASRTLLFMGSLDFYPNIDAALYLANTILPLIWAQDPGIRLILAGRRPPNMLCDLAADPRIEVIADPPDMTAIARRGSIALAPLRIGSGTRIKILEAFALGIPVVTTSLGCEGLDVTDEKHLLVRDNPEQFAAAALELLNNLALAANLRLAGRRLVEDCYDSNVLFQKLENELHQLAAASPQ
jgi:glycosyltransferase involved in cell wall biosynthesis